MDLSRQKSAGFNLRQLVLGVVVWWILMALGYTINDFFWRRCRVALNPEKYIVTCPLCGTKKPVNSDLFNHSNPYEKSIAKISNPVHNPASQADLKGIDLTEIAKHEDLNWIKRQVILRCAEIIQKLTA